MAESAQGFHGTVILLQSRVFSEGFEGMLRHSLGSEVLSGVKFERADLPYEMRTLFSDSRLQQMARRGSVLVIADEAIAGYSNEDRQRLEEFLGDAKVRMNAYAPDVPFLIQSTSFRREALTFTDLPPMHYFEVSEGTEKIAATIREVFSGRRSGPTE